MSSSATVTITKARMNLNKSFQLKSGDDLVTNSSAAVTDKATDCDDDDRYMYDFDTIHYLSPATTNRTVHEGDFDYYQFMPHMPSIKDLIPFTPSESTISCEYIQLQRTIAIIKPEAMVYKDAVLKVINEAGFKVLYCRTLHLTPEQVTELYIKQYGCPSFPNKVISMSMGPLMVLSMARLDAVEKWKTLVGPGRALRPEWFYPLNVRTRFGLQPEMPEALHATESAAEAPRENRFFYPEPILEPLDEDEAKVQDYCDLNTNPTLLAGLTELVRVKPADPVIFLAEWLLNNNPFKPKQPYQFAMAPT